MNAMIKDALRRLVVTICIMWLWESRDVENRNLRFYVYTSEIDFYDPRMVGSRIEVDFQIKPTPGKDSAKLRVAARHKEY